MPGHLGFEVDGKSMLIRGVLAFSQVGAGTHLEAKFRHATQGLHEGDAPADGPDGKDFPKQMAGFKTFCERRATG